MKFYVFLIISALFVTVANAQTYSFTWQGANGYSMQGAMLLAADAPTIGVATQDDVACFEIHGFQKGEKIGAWYLQDLLPTTTWRLNFNVSKSAFMVIGDGLAMPQAWNMDGAGDNCGVDGFGFNLGSYAQDLCLNNSLLVQSQVPPPQPFPAVQVQSYAFGDVSCQGPLMLSQLEMR